MKLYSRMTCAFLLLTVLLSFAACSPAPKKSIDWDLQGVWLNQDGTVLDDRAPQALSVSGSFPSKFENRDSVKMDLEVSWPDCTIVPNDNLKDNIGYAQFADKHEGQAFYLISTWLYYTQVNDCTGISFMICPDEGFLVANLGQDYLVASTDPNADAAEIFAFYKEYVHVSQ